MLGGKADKELGGMSKNPRMKSKKADMELGSTMSNKGFGITKKEFLDQKGFGLTKKKL